MVNVKDINPVFPTTPPRPVNDVERQRQEQERRRRQNEKRKDDDRAGDDDRQIDEYA